MTLLILFGGKSTEYEVSLMSAYSVITEADREKYDLVTVGITDSGKWFLCDCPPESIRDGSWCADVDALEPVAFDLNGTRELILQKSGARIKVDAAFPVLHGKNGEDGTVQGMFSLAGVPCVGCKCTASALSMDKSFTKAVAAAAGIPVARSLTLTTFDIENEIAAVVDRIETEFNYPLFVKPANAGSSVGVTKAADRRSLVWGLALATSFDRRVLVEEFVHGAEIEVALTGSDDDLTVSVPGEINPGSDFYDYDTKYKGDTASYFIPARIPAEVAETVRSYAAEVYTALGCEGMARADFFVDYSPEGGTADIVFNEINSIPGFTPISMFPKLYCKSEGCTYGELIDRLVALALK